MICFTFWDRQNNKDIYEICQKEIVIHWVRKRQREWNDYITIIKDNRVAKKQATLNFSKDWPSDHWVRS